MPAFTSSALVTEFLSVEEQRAAIFAAQDVPATVEVPEDGGEEVVRYGYAPAAERALERLTTAFAPAVEKAARATKVLDHDEAVAVALLELVEAVRDFDLEAPLPFSATIATRLRYAVLRAARGNDIVRVKDNVAAVYWRLIHKHGGDFASAYAEVKSTPNGLAPSTFLAVHNVVSGVDSLDPVITTEDSDTARYALVSSVTSHEDRIALVAEVDWLFTLVSDRQESILRLAYGFCDLATEKVRVAHSFRIGEELTDSQIAYVLGITRPTAQRERAKALATMRAALEDRDSETA